MQNMTNVGKIGQTQMRDGVLWTKAKNYEWGQTVYDVQLTINFPPGTRGREVDAKITANNISFGLKGQEPIVQGELTYTIKPKESTWSVDPENGEVLVMLQKAVKHENWASVVKGKDVTDPFTLEEMGKKMMLEKFQLENPGFDFSGAQFSGALPADPKNFYPGRD